MIYECVVASFVICYYMLLYDVIENHMLLYDVIENHMLLYDFPKAYNKKWNLM